MKTHFSKEKTYSIQQFTSSTSTWRHKTDLQTCQIWQNTNNLSIAQAYLIQPTNDLQIHARRNQQHIVNAIGYSSVCQNRMYILIERVINRLSQCRSLTETQALRILYAIFRGLEELSSLFGIISISQNCVCFTDQGKIKIWAHSNLSESVPMEPMYNSGMSGVNAQKQVIKKTVEMIEKKCFNQKIFFLLKKGVETGKIKSYSQVHQQIFKIANSLFIEVGQLHPPQKKMEDNDSKLSFSSTLYNQFNTPYLSIEHSYSKSNVTNPMTYQQELPVLNQYSQPLTDRSYKSSMSHHVSSQMNNNDSKNMGLSEKLNKHIRHRSFFQNQKNPQKLINTSPSGFLNSNTNKLGQMNSTREGILPANKIREDCFHSAPISPRESKEKNFKKKQNFIQNDIKRQYQARFAVKNANFIEDQKYVKERQKKEQILIVQNRRNSNKEQNSQFYKLSDTQKEIEDSFANNFVIEPKEIQVKGDFQTFGVLDSLSDRRLQNSGSMGRNGSTCFLDLDVQGMDREIRKKLQMKRMSKNRSSSKRISIRLPTLVSQGEALEDYNELQNHLNQQDQNKNENKQPKKSPSKEKSGFYEESKPEKDVNSVSATQKKMLYYQKPINGKYYSINTEGESKERKKYLFNNRVSRNEEENKQGHKFTFNPAQGKQNARPLHNFNKHSQNNKMFFLGNSKSSQASNFRQF